MTVLATDAQAEGESSHDSDEFFMRNRLWKVLQIGEFVGRLGLNGNSRHRQRQDQPRCRKTCRAKSAEHTFRLPLRLLVSDSLPLVQATFKDYRLAWPLWWGGMQFRVRNLSGRCQRNANS